MRFITLAIIFSILYTTFLGTTTLIQSNGLSYIKPFISPLWNKQEEVLAQRAMPLNDRYANESVNEVFKNNILLTLQYLSGNVKTSGDINWDAVREPFSYEFTLNPGEVFAFHEDTLPQYEGKTRVTTNAHFNASDGFLSSGYLYGDGVCHLASLINWVSRDAGLQVIAPTDHNFARIPDVPGQYGTSIYLSPGQSAVNQAQNLYIENTLNKPVKFVFDYADEIVTVKVEKKS